MSHRIRTTSATLAALTLAIAGAAFALPGTGAATAPNQTVGPKDQARVPISQTSETTRRAPIGCASVAWPYAPPECGFSGEPRPRPVRIIPIDRRAG
jgi:hypothetical protein